MPISFALRPVLQRARAVSRVALVRQFAVDANAGAVALPTYTVAEVGPEVGGASSEKYGQSIVKRIPGHTKKLNPLARQISGLGVQEAIAQMAFSQQRRASYVRKALENAVRNADFHAGLGPSQLVVERAVTGKDLTSARLRYHSKGRAGRSHYRTSRVTIKLREMRPEEAPKLLKFKNPLPTPAQKAAFDPRSY